MFRDTFAVEMMLAGVPIDQVSILLGHASVKKITEKHYSPWVKARQFELQQVCEMLGQLKSRRQRSPPTIEDGRAHVELT
jgi:hypothetical protein